MSRLKIGLLCVISENVARWNSEQFIRQDISNKQWRTVGGFWGSTPPPPKLRSFYKANLNSQFLEKYIRNYVIRTRISLICKLSGTPD
jgi:hypothetical protein